MSHPVTHFEILGKDAALLRKFYGDAFGWQMRMQTGEYAMVTEGSSDGISGGIGQAVSGRLGHVTFYVEVDDVGAMLTRLKSLGGKTVLPETVLPGGPTIGLFKDPEGHTVGLAMSGSAK